MRRTKQKRAAPAKTRTDESFTLRDWDGARAFLEVARRGSLRSAAHALRESVNTVRRQIDEFERDVGLTLLTRHVDGVRVTEEGAQLLAAARRMEMASFDIARMRHRDVSLKGEVRLSVTEGLGSFWLVPQLARFGTSHPKLLVNMICTMNPADVLRLESDIGIQLSRPTAPDLRILRLGTMHTMPFAARRYLDTHGCPKTVAEFGKHRMVLQDVDQINSEAKFHRLFPSAQIADIASFRTNVSSAHYFAISCGAGIGVLPTYAGGISERIVPVDIDGIRFAYDVWLAYHPDAARIPRVRRTIDWLIDAFSPKIYPWFAKEFIHPRDLPREAGGISLSSLYEGYDCFL
ncbi:MAG: LysR family transcriptional regulator [Alphaproteobacteria bacterium]|nr:LysR family transcriptional regulator [Alphaproteobacteria bacterium]